MVAYGVRRRRWRRRLLLRRRRLRRAHLVVRRSKTRKNTFKTKNWPVHLLFTTFARKRSSCFRITVKRIPITTFSRISLSYLSSAVFFFFFGGFWRSFAIVHIYHQYNKFSFPHICIWELVIRSRKISFLYNIMLFWLFLAYSYLPIIMFWYVILMIRVSENYYYKIGVWVKHSYKISNGNPYTRNFHFDYLWGFLF